MSNAPSALHVLRSWGVASHTFVRTTLRRTPGRNVVLCRERHPVAAGATGRDPWIVVVRPTGKPGVAAGLAIGAAARPDVVHAHFAHELLLADRLSRHLRKPLVVSLYGHDLLVELRDGAPGLDVLWRADAVVALSRAFAEEVVAFGVAADRVAVIPAGVEPAELPERPTHRRPGPVRVLFVGRLVEKKGPVDAVQAVARAIALGADVELTVLGTGPLAAAVEEARAPLGDRVRRGDGADRAEVLTALAHADVVLTPSKVAADGDAETLLVVNVEAQAAGVPVVSTRSGGIPDGVGPESGILVHEGDVAALADAVAALAADPARRAAMGRAGRAWVGAHRTAALAGARTAALHRSISTGDGVPADLRSEPVSTHG